MSKPYIKFKINQILDYYNHCQNNGKLLVADKQNKQTKFQVKEFAATTSLSERSVQRYVKDNLKQPIHSYFRNLRLERAALLLEVTDQEIRSIADEAGYVEHSSFTKEFKQRFSVSPEVFRQNLKKEKSIDDSQLDYSIEELPETQLIYFSHIGGYDSCDTTDFEEQMWDQLVAIAQEQGILSDSPTCYGIAFDDSKLRIDNSCRFYACVQVESLPSKNSLINSITISAGRYAKFIHRGSYSEIETRYQRIYDFFRINNSIRLRNDRNVLERYPNSLYDTPTDELITELLFPIY